MLWSDSAKRLKREKLTKFGENLNLYRNKFLNPVTTGFVVYIIYKGIIYKYIIKAVSVRRLDHIDLKTSMLMEKL